MRATDTMREWLVFCQPCDKKFEIWEWASKLPIKCPSCDQPTELYHEGDRSAAVIGDDIPGGVEIRHLDPTPRRYYSKTEIKRRCNEKGMNWADDTPGPYKVRWSGKKT